MKICKCNKCGKEISEDEATSWDFICPYSSGFDSDRVEIDLCPPCLDEEIRRMETEWELPVRTEWCV